MKLANGFAVALTLLVMTACGGSNAADKARPGGKAEPGQGTSDKLAKGGSNAAVGKTTAAAADLFQVSAVRLSSENFYANVDLSAEVDVAPPIPDGIAFEYRWYVNNQEVADATGATLESGNFRKHQWIICEARALAGEKVSGWVQSNWVRAADSPPQVAPVAVANFSVPGRFTYQLKASDADNDELTYELLSPLDMGIELDKKTGLLTWNLDKTLVEKLGETIEISLSVSDNDAKPTTGTITLRFQKRTERKSP